jgi:hypothetical protein
MVGIIVQNVLRLAPKILTHLGNAASVVSAVVEIVQLKLRRS